MLFNIRGIEIDVPLPHSLEEADKRIDELTLVHQRLESEIKLLSHKSPLRQSKGMAFQETMIELQVLKRWRKNANVILQNLLTHSDIVNSRELRTEPGLIKHLYLELRHFTKEHGLAIENGSKLAAVLSAAQYWLRNHYSTTLPATDLVQDLIEEEAERQKQAAILRAQQKQAAAQRAQQKEAALLEAQQKQAAAQRAQQKEAAARRAQQKEALQAQREQEAAVLQAQREQEAAVLQAQKEKEETQKALSLLSQFRKQQMT